MEPSIPSCARVLLPVVAFGLLAGGLTAQEYRDDAAPAYGEEVSARIWFDRGDEPLFDRGDRVRIYYRASRDAHVAIFHIDTNGTTRMVHPRSPEDDNRIRGGRDYRLLFPRSPYWYVDDHPGMGYYFIVTSPQPLDFSRFDFSYYDGGWDLTRVGRNVYSDPYVAMDDYVAALIPEWEYASYGLDFATYHVGSERQDYPRFLCYDCHGFRSYTSWNPYHYHCTSFRVVVYNDPWYYPSYRYRGTRVVYADIPYADIPRVRLPRYEFKERADGEPGRPIVATRASAGPGVGGDPAPRRGPSGIGSGGDAPRVRPNDARPSAGDAAPRRPGVPTDVGTPRRGVGSSPDGPATGRPVVGSPTVGRPERNPDGGAGRVETDADRTRPTVVLPGRGRAAPTGEGAARDEGSVSTPTTSSGGSRFVPVLPPRGSTPRSTPSAGTGRPAIPRAGAGEERRRPVLERRPPTERGSGGSDGSASGGDEPRERPSSPVRPPVRRGTPPVGGGAAGGAVRPGRSGAGGTAVPARPPTAGSRPSAGSGGRAVPARPPVAGSGGRPTGPTRPPVVKPRGGGGASGSVGRTRSGGGAAPPRRPPVRVKPRSGGGASGGARSGAPARVRPRSGGSSGAARSGPPVRVRPRGGSGGTSGATRPPVRVRSGGGDAGDDGGGGGPI